DIFDLQDRIAGRVIGGIAPSLERAEIERVKRKSGNLQAYDYFLRCRANWHLMSAESNREALELARNAVELDPDFALGHGAIALSHCHARSFGWMIDEVNELAEADRAIHRALELDRGDANVLTYCGQTALIAFRRVEESAALLDQAVV